MLRTSTALAAAAALAASGAVAADDDELVFGPMMPARISGEWHYQELVSDGVVEMDDDLVGHMEGAVTRYRVTSDDPRFGGPATATGRWDGWWPPALVAMVESEWVVGTAGDTWTGSNRMAASMADEDPLNVPEQLFLDGAGAYEGLTAYVVVDHEDESYVGVIIPDEMPELPPDWVEIWQASYEEPADGD